MHDAHFLGFCASALHRDVRRRFHASLAMPFQQSACNIICVPYFCRFPTQRVVHPVLQCDTITFYIKSPPEWRAPQRPAWLIKWLCMGNSLPACNFCHRLSDAFWAFEGVDGSNGRIGSTVLVRCVSCEPQRLCRWRGVSSNYVPGYLGLPCVSAAAWSACCLLACNGADKHRNECLVYYETLPCSYCKRLSLSSSEPRFLQLFRWWAFTLIFV